MPSRLAIASGDVPTSTPSAPSLRGDAMYFRRAEVQWDNGRTDIVTAETLVLDDGS